MEHTAATAGLAKLLDASVRPVYAIDASRRIVYGNAPLAAWLGLDLPQIVGRSVEYHSEATTTAGRPREAASPLTDLCPPPRTLAGEACSGAVGCVGRDGRLVHRRAEFVPLGGLTATTSNGVVTDQASITGVLVFLATTDMRTEEISAELADDPTGDDLHRAIRRFRRNQSADYAIETLLGQSPAMQKVRAQVAAAASSHANVIVRGRRGSGRAHVARAIHYQTEDAGSLLPIDCGATSEESFGRTLESAKTVGGKNTSTVLLLNLERLPATLQPILLTESTGSSRSARFIATLADEKSRAQDATDNVSPVSPPLLTALSIISIDVPPLADRMDDLPLLAQYFLEVANRGAAKQVGSLRPDALDQLALYAWPGELDELRNAIKLAHDACGTHEITPSDLPPVIHHAAKTAALPKRFVEKIVLEDLLAEIEREIVARALAQAGGNKSAAADLLGMTRPRLYRRLVQLGLVSETNEADT